ncbi:MAG: ATP synthase F1 subunit gamma [Myxococcales bacterium]|nr:ATP synthase F1 subunit gamma [Myxococcales bacterium]
MANLKDIRKRIRTVKNTQKITSAMKMVAAAKLNRAKDAITRARPYGQKIDEVTSQLGALVDEDAHPLLRQHDEAEGGTALLVVLTSDRGLCGGFNATLLRRVDSFRKHHAKTFDALHLKVIGKKGRDWIRRSEPEHVKYHPDLLIGGVSFAIAKEIAQELIQGFTDGTYDHVYIAYNEFKSAITQEQRVDRLLPIGQVGDEDASDDNREAIFEPGRDALLEVILPKYIEVLVHQAMLDSVASEQGSRMTAMDNATNNAKDMIASLTLKYNRARQAAITRELVEITSGAEALHG